MCFRTKNHRQPFLNTCWAAGHNTSSWTYSPVLWRFDRSHIRRCCTQTEAESDGRVTAEMYGERDESQTELGAAPLTYLHDSWRNSKGIDRMEEPLAPMAVWQETTTTPDVCLHHTSWSMLFWAVKAFYYMNTFNCYIMYKLIPQLTSK